MMIIALIGMTALHAIELPAGAAPAPVTFDHFPERLHAFAWVNWELVPVERLAEVVGASPEEIAELGRSMGLPEPPAISEDQWRRSYITIIRRNWHLLPYEADADATRLDGREIGVHPSRRRFPLCQAGQSEAQVRTVGLCASVGEGRCEGLRDPCARVRGLPSGLGQRNGSPVRIRRAPLSDAEAPSASGA